MIWFGKYLSFVPDDFTWKIFSIVHPSVFYRFIHIGVVCTLGEKQDTPWTGGQSIAGPSAYFFLMYFSVRLWMNPCHKCQFKLPGSITEISPGLHCSIYYFSIVSKPNQKLLLISGSECVEPLSVNLLAAHIICPSCQSLFSQHNTHKHPSTHSSLSMHPSI